MIPPFDYKLGPQINLLSKKYLLHPFDHYFQPLDRAQSLPVLTTHDSLNGLYNYIIAYPRYLPTARIDHWRNVQKLRIVTIICLRKHTLPNNYTRTAVHKYINFVWAKYIPAQLRHVCFFYVEEMKI